jgi:phosphatidylethanolamine/phosphatidyl-N-methylethanolamine N-methyltransferase
MDTQAVREAYRKWAGFYDTSFGLVSTAARRRAVAAVNALPGSDVLEVGVGTGLALPLYRSDKKVTGIDLSTEMLEQARLRVERRKLGNVTSLREMDAEAMTFTDASFDIATAMFVASVVPNPRRLLSELKRIVRPGGHILFINHFAAEGGLRLMIERAMAPASHILGWHPDFLLESLLGPDDCQRATMKGAPPFGIFTLVHLPR